MGEGSGRGGVTGSPSDNGQTTAGGGRSLRRIALIVAVVGGVAVFLGFRKASQVWRSRGREAVNGRH